MIAIGTLKAKKIYLGNTEVEKVYKGVDIIYEKMPYDTEVEYLESTGTQYIDTLYKGNTTKTRAEMKITVIGSGSQFICGSRNTAYKIENDSCAFLYYQSALRADWATGKGSSGTINISRNIPIEVSITRGTCIVDGVTHTYSNNTSINQSNSILLFTIKDSLTSSFVGKIHYFKIYDNNVLVMDLIPVRVGQVGYMYDKISGQLFGNSGSGSFILGNDIN